MILLWFLSTRYYWIGSQAPAADVDQVSDKALLLDDTLGGNSVVHREVEAHESHRFLALFKESGEVFSAGPTNSRKELNI